MSCLPASNASTEPDSGWSVIGNFPRVLRTWPWPRPPRGMGRRRATVTGLPPASLFAWWRIVRDYGCQAGSHQSSAPFHLNLDEGELERVVVDDVVLDPGRAEVADAGAELAVARLAAGLGE